MSTIQMVAKCYLCHATSEPYTSQGPLVLPEGWRAVRRGYAGVIMICPTCNSRGLKYQKDLVEATTPAPPPTEKAPSTSMHTSSKEMAKPSYLERQMGRLSAARRAKVEALAQQIIATNRSALLHDSVPPATEKALAVVRLRTSTWSDRKGVHIRRSLTYLRKLCRGFNVLEEDVSNLGAEDAVGQITNLEECPDGIYEVRVCNQSTDWETGYVDGYDLKLIPFLPQEKP